MSSNTQIKTILVLAANPTNTSPLRLGEEVREIKQGLQRASKREQFKLEQEWAVRERDFYRAILENKPQIVHFCGHGAGDDGIVLEDDMGHPIPVGKKALSRLFKLFAVKGVECVVLNACYSEIQALAISQYIKHVIGMNQAIGDKAAISFARAFYEALGAGEIVDDAFEYACVPLVELKEDQTPVLKTTLIHPADIQFEAGDIPPNPYLGLSAFGEKDAALFFGRETFTEELFQMTYQQPLAAVIGASGSGKSSVVFAGLIPKLREEGTWVIESIRPKSEPFYELALALVRQLEPNIDGVEKALKSGKLTKSLKKGEVKLHQIVSQILENKPNKRFLLVVDQFEELYTQCQDKQEQQRFIDTLLLVINQKSITLIFTLRADFYGYVLSYRPFGEVLNKFIHKPLTLMSREELKTAVEQPARKLDVKLQTHLAQRILDDVGDEPGNLPLLEFALTQLWDNQKNGELTHKAYNDIGGVKQALVKHAEQVYSRLSNSQQQQAQRVFLALVRLGEGTEDTRRVATREEIGRENWELVTSLAGSEARLVVTGRNDNSEEETVEVVHEALIREWGRLRQWVNENREKLIQKRKIEAGAIEWRDKGKSKDYLLGGKQLNEAKAFQKEQITRLSLSPLASEFIQKSIQVRRSKSLRTTALAAIPILIAFMGVIPVIREQNVQNALQTLEDSKKLGFHEASKKLGFREALETVTQGCLARYQLDWMYPPLVTFLFGSCTNLNSHNFKSADLYRINLAGVNLERANLERANLSLAKLESAVLTDANLSRANLKSAVLTDARLESANLERANLERAVLTDAVLTDAVLTDARLESANLERANLERANLEDARLESANLESASLESAKLKNANLSFARMKRAYLENAVFTDDANLYHANLTGAILTKANLTGAYLTKADLTGAHLYHANLTGAHLADANLTGADLTGANLTGANLTGANLTKADLTGTKLQKAMYTDKSTLPPNCRILYSVSSPCPTIFSPNFDPEAAGMILKK